MATFCVNAGLAITTARLIGVGQAIPSYIGWGTGAGTTAVTDTTLFTETSYVGYARDNGTYSQVTTTATDDTWQLLGTITNNSGSTQAITNAGCFDASTVGNMFVKGDFATINVPNGGGIAFTITNQYQN